jgi:hypothetical protein
VASRPRSRAHSRTCARSRRRPEDRWPIASSSALFLTDLSQFAKVNEIMQQYFTRPFPARSTIGVASLPRGAQFEVEAVMTIGAR